MKLRILGDSLRLRLSQGEVAAFAKDGRVTQTIRFGPTGSMTYALEHAGDVSSLNAVFDGGASRAESRAEIVVRMPSAMARAWASSDEISLKAEQHLGGEEALALLVEKDFKCVVPRAGEEQYDGFPHPTGAC